MANQIVKLKKGSDYLYPYADFMGIDLSNLIASISFLNTTSNTYTATEDCFLVLPYAGTNEHRIGWFWIDDVKVGKYINGQQYRIPLKKGQVWKRTQDATTYGDYDNILYVYGIKR